MELQYRCQQVDLKAKPDPATLVELISNIFKVGLAPVNVRVPKLTLPYQKKLIPQKILAHCKYASSVAKSIGVPTIKAPLGLPIV